MLEVLTDFIRDFTRIDNQSLTILLVALGWATLLVQVGLQSKTFTALFIPGMFLGGMAAFYVARLYMLSIFPAKDMNAVALSTLGIAAGFLATVLVVRFVYWVGDLRKPITFETRH
jgi:H+/Cl- antiporter ClcA